MNDNNDQLNFANTLTIREKLIEELIEEKTSFLNASIENLKRVDGYVLGSRESINRVTDHIKKQKKELVDLIAQKNVTQEVVNLIENALQNILATAKNISADAEKLFYSKQGELVCLKQELEKLSLIKANHESAILNIQKQQEQNAKKAEIVVTEKETKEKAIRPDKNPNTKIGRAALDIMERKKKAVSSLKTSQENVPKKRGRKSKA